MSDHKDLQELIANDKKLTEIKRLLMKFKAWRTTQRQYEETEREWIMRAIIQSELIADISEITGE
jgi:hypothetical protein